MGKQDGGQRLLSMGNKAGHVPGEAVLESLIEKHGWVICGQEASDDGETPVHAYTLGLSRMGMAELIVVGLPHPVGGGLLNELAQEQLAKVIRFGKPLPGPVAVENVVRKLYLLQVDRDAMARYAPLVERLGGQRPRAFQLCWADPSGVFPWDRSFDGGPWEQPVLGDAPAPAQ